MKGKVSLIGAGPGDIGLLTLRGYDLITTAEVVVYDRLVSSEILDLIPSSAQRIDVGKKSNNHLVPQTDINKILLEKALEGKNVIRLKGGDPYLFGRGGEELDLLVENNISFEVVPGITSAISAPSYAGIPVTHRDFCSSVHIITGHQKENEPLKIPFDALCKMNGTLVFLMGVSSLETIMQGLLTAGINPNMPAALVENGTRNNQRKVISTVENLYKAATSQNFKSPSIIIVGEVCKLSDGYDWFSKRPLFGKRIITTNPQNSQGNLSRKLRLLGAEVIECPCISIIELGKVEQNKKVEEKNETYKLDKINENGIIKNYIETINQYSWILFTSKNGVEIFFKNLKEEKKDSRILGNIKIAAIGRATAAELEKYGIRADFVPRVYDGTNLAHEIAKIIKNNEKTLLFRALKGNSEILKIFEENSLQITDVPVYDTEICIIDKKKALQIFEQSKVDFVTFTSASTVEGFVSNFGSDVLKSFKGICIGKQTALAASKYGIEHIISNESSFDSLIEKILEVSNNQNNL